MNYDRQLTLSVGNNRKSIQWKPYKVSVADFYQRLATPFQGTETMAEYFGMRKAQQDDLKDVGGFVGGQLQGPRRKAAAVLARDLVTLDFDSLPPFSTDKLLEIVDSLGCSYCVYSTRKHRPEAPRLRVVLPSSRTMSPEEHEACARWLADKIGINWVDPTTFESCRLMYWPSVCKDGEYIYRTKDAPMFDVDTILGHYDNWRDQTQWPQVPGALNIPRLSAKQGDPLEKAGTVGAFCRVYDIPAAMEKFLPGIYEPTDGYSDRYTFTGGSTTGGAVLYDDGKFMYSHHATDPCGNKLVNAFDLVRLHKFGDLDDEAKPDIAHNRLPSYLAMCDLAIKDDGVAEELTRERLERAQSDFEDLEGVDTTQNAESDSSGAVAVPEAPKVTIKLDLNSQTGKPYPTIDNCGLLLDQDPRLAGKLAFSEFQERPMVMGRLPWEKTEGSYPRAWTDADLSGLYWFMEHLWGISKRPAIDAAFDITTHEHKFHEVRDYLTALSWDGLPRLDTLFIDYLGATDTEFTRTVTRKMMCAAVARILKPGVKFDNMLILVGDQGKNKSMFLRTLARNWIDDSFTTFEGKEAQERLPGSWFVEVAELDAFRKSDVARIKQFLSTPEDKYRASYARNTKIVKRQCVFFGTCNSTEFLRDETGNRRFWAIDLGDGHTRTKNPTTITDAEVDQIWAEAMYQYQIMGESLWLSEDMQKEAEKVQKAHMVTDAREGMVFDFVAKKVPSDWQDWSLEKRRMFWASLDDGQPVNEEIQLVERDRICACDVWCELFNRPLDDVQRDVRAINAILAKMEGWEKKVMRNGCYGLVKGFIKKAVTE